MKVAMEGIDPKQADLGIKGFSPLCRSPGATVANINALRLHLQHEKGLARFNSLDHNVAARLASLRASISRLENMECPFRRSRPSQCAVQVVGRRWAD